jgi:RimJ/RimL family protein N-acetyltransferase
MESGSVHNDFFGRGEMKYNNIETLRLNIVEATPADVETIIEIESHKDNRDFIWIGTTEQHLEEIEDPNHLLLLFRAKEDGRIVGYGLARIDWKSEVFELRRIAITEKGLGFGREAMEAIMAFAFNEFGTNRFWLDVYPDNLIGIRLYESLGMHLDGVLRQNYKSSRGYLDQIIYSMLKSEYFGSLV